MAYRDLRDFIAQLEQLGELKRVSAGVSPYLEMTALCDRSLRTGGPALLFENPTGQRMPVLGNLFGTTRRVALGMGVADVSEVRKFGHVLAMLKEPEAPKGFKDLMGLSGMLKTLWNMAPRELRGAACQDVVWEGVDVDLPSPPLDPRFLPHSQGKPSTSGVGYAVTELARVIGWWGVIGLFIGALIGVVVDHFSRCCSKCGHKQ